MQLTDDNPDIKNVHSRKLNENKNKFTVIAHRGASGYAPENTMSAFQMAYEMGADMIELDVLLSSDGVPVVIHDLRLRRTAGSPKNVNQLSAAELQKLDAGSWFSPEFKNERIPELREVLEWAAGKIALNIEIKTEAVAGVFDNGIEEKTMRLVKEFAMEKHVVFSSFDYRVIRRIKEREPELRAAILYHKKSARRKTPAELVREFNADGMNLSRRQVFIPWIEELKEMEIPVWVYTVNKPGLMKRLIALGIDGIFSDRPDLLLEIAGR